MSKDKPPLKSGWIYQGPSRVRDWQPDLARCRAGVSDSSGFYSHQCYNKAKVTRTVDHNGKIVELGYCGVHDPVKVAERKTKSAAKMDEKLAKWRGEIDRKRAAHEALGLVRQIAKGHNDPRGACVDFLRDRGLPLEESE